MKCICKNCGKVIEEKDAVQITHEELAEMQHGDSEGGFSMHLSDRDRTTQICKACLEKFKG